MSRLPNQLNLWSCSISVSPVRRSLTLTIPAFASIFSLPFYGFYNKVVLSHILTLTHSLSPSFLFTILFSLLFSPPFLLAFLLLLCSCKPYSPLARDTGTTCDRTKATKGAIDLE